MRPDFHARALLVLAGLLGTSLALLLFPVEPWPASAVAALIVMATAMAYALLARRKRAAQRRSGAILDALGSQVADLPVAMRARLPLVLVTGDATSALFDRDGETCRLIHRGHGALWVRIDAIENLAYVAWALQQWRGGHAPDAVVLTLTPGTHPDPSSLITWATVARQMASDATRLLGRPLPGYVATYCPWTPGSHPVSSAIGFSGSRRVHPSSHVATLRTQLTHAMPKNTRQAWHRASAQHVLEWTAARVVPGLMVSTGTAHPWPLHGMAWIDAGPVHTGSCFYREQTGITGLGLSYQPPPAPLPFPETLLGGLTRTRALPLPWRTAATAISLVLLSAAAGTVISWHYNTALIERTNGDVERFRSLDPLHDEARRDALAQLIRTRDQLDAYQRVGVPAYLGFGLHHGHPLTARLNATIASYVAPDRLPTLVSLDSLSLFDAGKASLKPGSLNTLVAAVQLIQAHPDKRVLIAGHTDDAGDARSNLRLSVARAAAVRDWLMEATGLPETQFATQGYGDTRPTADNRTAEGRSRNRRVEITLLPDRAAR